MLRDLFTEIPCVTFSSIAATTNAHARIKCRRTDMAKMGKQESKGPAVAKKVAQSKYSKRDNCFPEYTTL